VIASADAGSRRRDRLGRSRLYVVTGARAEQGDLAGFLDAILGAGVDVVQLREKEAEAEDLLRWGNVFREAAERHGALFAVNDRPDVAVALGADVVHLGQKDLPVATARRIVGPHVLIGRSTHDEDQLASAGPEAEYVCVGPVHQTPTKPGRPATGLGLIRRAAELVARPWFAIGGINAGNVEEVLTAGARRIVVVRAITDAPDPARAAKELRALLPE
jgi:thiamine-phosphate pyrophosphorylase